MWVHDSADGSHVSGISRDVQAIFDPFGNAVHTALTFDVLGEDVLIAGAGPIGCMAAAIVRHGRGPGDVAGVGAVRFGADSTGLAGVGGV